MSALFTYWEYYLPSILLFGILTSVDDIRQGIIKNSYIIIGSLLGIGINVLLYMQKIIDLSTITVYGVSIIFAILLSFGLYWNEFWSAGDGKLLIAYTCLFPQTIIYGMIESITISLTLLLNMMIPFFLVGAWKSMSSNITNHKKNKINTTPLEIFTDILFVFSIPWLIETILASNGIHLPEIIPLLGMLFIATFLEKIKPYFGKLIKTLLTGFLQLRLFKINIIVKDDIMDDIGIILLLLPISIIRIITEYSLLITPEVILKLGVYYLIIKLLKQYIKDTALHHYTQKVTIRSLKRGMIIQDTIVEIYPEKIEDSLSPKQNPQQPIKKSIGYLASLLLLAKPQLGKDRITKADNNTKNQDNKASHNNYSKKENSSLIILDEKNKRLLQHAKYERIFIEALNDTDIKNLFEKYRKGKVQFKEVTIRKSIPFAPLAFLGVIITIIIKGVLGLEFL